MAGRHQRTNAPPPAASAGSARQNEYFVPRDGIDREVITADICRYLGNDALVRPGTYEVRSWVLSHTKFTALVLVAHSCQHPDGRVTQGYYITAYRNLTSVSPRPHTRRTNPMEP
jgi:hypothetical protein